MPTPESFIHMAKPVIGKAERDAVNAVLDSGILAQGPVTAKLEESFASTCRSQHGIATSSGTTALHVALLAHGIGPGDEVITTPFTFIATANAILHVGATPVFVDIEEETFNIDPSKIEAAISPKTKAILPVHIYGHPCDMDAILAIAEAHNLIVIEDACQAIGASYNGTPTGGFATGCFSMYATKNIMSGEGGMITTNDEAFADKCRLLRNHGMKERNKHEILGYNFRLNDLCSSIGLAQMGQLADFHAKRTANAEYFSANITSVEAPIVKDGYIHAWHQYAVLLDDRDAAAETLKEAGVGSSNFYPKSLTKHPHIREAIGTPPDLPVTDRISSQVLCIPVHPSLSEEDRERIVTAVNSL
ncbi:MAG: DegT/DnrJ/EryC1/StrS family aminotransferase [bacterium]|nr:DegT/DnrJ/EryC1/StrS family aminotransferase [bacterium]